MKKRISLALTQAVVQEDDDIVIGVDVGNKQTILLIRDHRRLSMECIEAERMSDVISAILGRIRQLHPKRVLVDKVGIGWAVYHELRSRIKDPEIDVIGVYYPIQVAA